MERLSRDTRDHNGPSKSSATLTLSSNGSSAGQSRAHQSSRSASQPPLSQGILSDLIRNSQQYPQNECTEEDLRILFADHEGANGKKRKKMASGAGDDNAKKNKTRTISKAKADRLLAKSNMNIVPIASLNSNMCTPITPHDERLHYPRHLIKAFNSCDPALLKETLDKFCESSVQGVYRYDGIQNPYGSNFRECEGVEGNYTLWSTLFQSAPDFVFRLFDLNIHFDTNPSQCVVTSSYDMHGTRIRDIKHVGSVGANNSIGSQSTDDDHNVNTGNTTISSKAAETSGFMAHSSISGDMTADSSYIDIYTMNRNELLGLPGHLVTPEVVDLLCLYEIQDFCLDSGLGIRDEDDEQDAASRQTSAMSLDDNYSSKVVDDISAMQGDEGVKNGDSIFTLDSAKQVYRITKNVQLVVEKRPLANTVKLMYKGSFIVYINPRNKIHKFEFVYKYMTES